MIFIFKSEEGDVCIVERAFLKSCNESVVKLRYGKYFHNTLNLNNRFVSKV